ncbi:MAG: hypothetical protein KDE51_19005 [Anaerolineales bacterium]|nr:hypothetical protein [Anaerolineales bacterium]
MNTQSNFSGNQMVVAVILLTFGLIGIVSQLYDAFGVGLLLLPGVAFALLMFGYLWRHNGLLIGGSVVGGLGAAVILVTEVHETAELPFKLGLFLILVGLGWVIGTFLSYLLTERPQWWPAVVGVFLAIPGIATVFNEPFWQLMSNLNPLLPYAIFLLGLAILVNAGFRNRPQT